MMGFSAAADAAILVRAAVDKVREMLAGRGLSGEELEAAIEFSVGMALVEDLWRVAGVEDMASTVSTEHASRAISLAVEAARWYIEAERRGLCDDVSLTITLGVRADGQKAERLYSVGMGESLEEGVARFLAITEEIARGERGAG